MPFKYESMQQRIIANTVIYPFPWPWSPCWIWLGKINSAGYGIISIRFKRGPRKGKVKSALVHRIAYAAFKRRQYGGPALT